MAPSYKKGFAAFLKAGTRLANQIDFGYCAYSESSWGCFAGRARRLRVYPCNLMQVMLSQGKMELVDLLMLLSPSKGTYRQFFPQRFQYIHTKP